MNNIIINADNTVDCICGFSVKSQSYTAHLKTMKHKHFMIGTYLPDSKPIPQKEHLFVPCGCGSTYLYSFYNKHLNTLRHQRYILSLN
jgi:hypothetical protein